MSFKTFIYSTAKRAGAFSLARTVNRKSLTILCYHGFSLADEHQFRPALFQSPGIFRERMHLLKQAGYRTLRLEEGLRRLHDGSLTSRDIVITIDDGFHSVYALAAPILEECGFTATIYVTTYYVTHPNPVFRLVMQYMAWKSKASRLDCKGLLPDVEAPDVEPLDKSIWRLINHGEKDLSEQGRLSLTEEVGRRLAVDVEAIRQRRNLHLMTPNEIGDLSQRGFDIQLHTHRHCMPVDPNDLRRELDDNRSIIHALTGTNPTHLCYPSGEYSRELWPVLMGAGIKSATTCEYGLNTTSTPLLGLKRFLDSDNIPAIIFEAELCSLSPTVRALVSRFRGARMKMPRAIVDG